MHHEALTGWITRHSLRLRMSLFFVGALVVMIVHHCFFWYLNWKSIDFDGGSSQIIFFLIYYENAVANVMTIITKGLLAAILGIAFTQLFWMQTKRRQYGVQEINDSLACKDSPVRSLKTVRSTFLFSAITLLSILLILITIFAPGAISFQDEILVNNTCVVKTVNMTHADIAVVDDETYVYHNPVAQVKGFVARVLLFGGPLTPVVDYDPSGDTTYNITFDSPSLECTNMSDTFDFSTALPDPAAVDGLITVWNASRSLSDASVLLTVSTRELSVGPPPVFAATPGGTPEAVSCVPYISTYTAQIETGFPNVSVPVVEVIHKKVSTPISPFPSVADDSDTAQQLDTQYYALVDAVLNLLIGNISYDPNTYDFTVGSPIIAYSPMGAAVADSPWHWSESMLTALPKLMENISLSILSDILSETDHPTLVSTKTTCLIEDTYYIYNPVRLFLSYGAGLLIGALAIGLGFYAIRVNGREELLEFGSILQFVTSMGAAFVDEKGGLEPGSDQLLLPYSERVV